MHFVVVGAGPAGLTAAETLRELEPAAAVTVLSRERSDPYAPPAMVDHFRTGATEPLFWKGKDVCRRLGVAHRAGAVVRAVRPERGEVLLETGEAVSYDRLIVASGGRLDAPVTGSTLPGVYDFKSLDAATALVERVRRGARRALIVGAGFIGVEIALLLAEIGASVTLVEMADHVMPRILDAETAAIVLAALRARGVEVRLGARATRFTGWLRATGVALASGERLPAQVCVAATGVKPNVAFLERSGVEVGSGVRVDERFRTSVAGVYAAGDVVESRHRITGELAVHANFTNAVAQGRACARSVLGLDPTYEGAETLHSLKHLGIPVVAVGVMDGDEVLVGRSGPALRKIWLRGGRITGFRLAGEIRAAGVLRSLMLTQADVAPLRERLLAPSFGSGALALAAMGLG